MSKENFISSNVSVEDPVKISTVFDTPDEKQMPRFDMGEGLDKEEEKIIRVAVLFCHGMGQQVPYETITNVAEALQRKQSSKNFSVSQLLFEEDVYARAQCVLENEKKEEREVHIYEAYWAPYTEGQISFYETVKFLLKSGAGGIRYALGKKFVRWIFGDFREFKESWVKIPVFILVTLALVILIAGPFALTGASVYYYITDQWGWLESLLYILVSGGVLVWIKFFVQKFVGDVAIYVSSHELNKFYETRSKIKECANGMAKAIYSAVSDKEGNFLYDKIVIVGHSLGSVIIYDTLNSLINMDNIADTSSSVKHLKVLERTKYLITFGSPLDKTAFIFRNQLKGRSAIREALAASKQPMILDYKYRPEKWVNIFSMLDLVSAKLRYYDWPEWEESKNPKRIINLPDKGARTFKNVFGIFGLRAHSQYWNHEILMNTLLKAIFTK